MGLPNFLCIGAQKAGTTWLHHMLKQHPDIWLPPVKEIHFFDRSIDNKKSFSENFNRYKRAIQKHKKAKPEVENDEYVYELNYLTSLASDDFLKDSWYSRIFDHRTAVERISGEITPAYLDMEKPRVEKAAKMLRDAKFIAIIRDPLARAVSQIRMTAERSKLTTIDETSWRRFLHHMRQGPRGLYHRSIPNWKNAAGTDRLLFLPFAMLKNEPETLLTTIEDFIGAPRFGNYVAAEEGVNVSQKIEIPDWVTDKLVQQTAPAKEFLISEFGRDFFEQTR